MSETAWCGNFGCGECYDCKCHQIGIMISTNETLETKLKASEAECERLEKLIDDISGYTDFYSDSYDSDTFSCGQSTQLYLNEELRRQEAKLKEEGR